jgi:hypothetical protein
MVDGNSPTEKYSTVFDRVLCYAWNNTSLRIKEYLFFTKIVWKANVERMLVNHVLK